MKRSCSKSGSREKSKGKKFLVTENTLSKEKKKISNKAKPFKKFNVQVYFYLISGRVSLKAKVNRKIIKKKYIRIIIFLEQKTVKNYFKHQIKVYTFN